MKPFNGRALFLDRSDINTDEIIPARYLTEITRDALAPYLLEDLKLEGFDPRAGYRRQAGHRHPGQFRLWQLPRTRPLGP